MREQAAGFNFGHERVGVLYARLACRYPVEAVQLAHDVEGELGEQHARTASVVGDDASQALIGEVHLAVVAGGAVEIEVVETLDVEVEVKLTHIFAAYSLVHGLQEGNELAHLDDLDFFVIEMIRVRVPFIDVDAQ